MVKVFSMFSGIGGFELGIKQSNLYHEFIGYSEIDKHAIKIYEKNFPGVKNYGDATTIRGDELPDFDLLVAGFPCQAFSYAGFGRGLDDSRGTLFFDIARILAEKRPRYLVLENVKGLLSNEQGKTFQTILGILTNLGYRVEWQVLNSANYGVPQTRERVYIVGHYADSRRSRRKIFPLPVQNQEPNREISDKVAAFASIDRTDVRMNGRRFKEPGDPSFTLTGMDAHGILMWDGRHKVNTLRASVIFELMYKGKVIRRLTEIECERLQGFPDNWTQGISMTQRYRCLGNAVTVNVIEAISNALGEFINENES